MGMAGNDGTEVPPSGPAAGPALLTVGVVAAAAQFGHTCGFFAVLAAVLPEFSVWLDSTGTAGVGARLGLSH